MLLGAFGKEGSLLVGKLPACSRCPFSVSFLGEGSPTTEEKIGYQLILTSLEDLGRVLVLCGLAPPKKSDGRICATCRRPR